MKKSSSKTVNKSDLPFIISMLIYLLFIFICFKSFGFFKGFLITLISIIPFSLYAQKLTFKLKSADELWAKWKNINMDDQYIRIRKAVEGDLIFLSADPVYKMAPMQSLWQTYTLRMP